jgi:hypothetical protein
MASYRTLESETRLPYGTRHADPRFFADLAVGLQAIVAAHKKRR